MSDPRREIAGQRGRLERAAHAEAVAAAAGVWPARWEREIRNDGRWIELHGKFYPAPGWVPAGVSAGDRVRLARIHAWSKGKAVSV